MVTSDTHQNALELNDPETMTGTEPVIWLLGKTGAGKTTLVRSLTGLSDVAIGNGYQPCTKASVEFPFPRSSPVMRFLDTRGLGEANYDPQEDLKHCSERSHVILVVSRLDDPVQNEIAQVLKNIHKRSSTTEIIIVHTGADLLSDDQQRSRAHHANQHTFESAVGKPLSDVETGIFDPALGLSETGAEGLIHLLAGALPNVALLLQERDAREAERQQFYASKSLVMRYATLAGALDTTPLVGTFAVPAIQTGLLRALASQYRVVWTREHIRRFTMALGVGVISRFGGGYLSRQLAKLIPVYGQTVGAAASGSLGFAVTYALGRAAAYYLYQTANVAPLDQQELRKIYKSALLNRRG